MSVSYCVKGLKEKTEEYEKKLTIYKTCRELNVPVPSEITDFFDNGEYCEDGVVVNMPSGAVNESGDCYRVFYDVDLSKIPDGVTKIRFEISC